MRIMNAILVVALAGCVAPPPPEPARDYGRDVAALAEEAWQRLLAGSPFMQVRTGQLLRELPDLTPEQAEADVAFARSMLERIRAIPADAVSRQDALTLALLRWDAENAIEAEPYYWLRFPVTPYRAGFNLSFLHQAIPDYPFDGPDKTESYLTLLAEYAGQLEQMRAHLEGQMERGIYLPAPALPGIVGTFRAYRAGAGELMRVPAERLEALTDEDRESFVAAATVGRSSTCSSRRDWWSTRA